MSAEIIVLRLLHILGGVFWVGAITYATFFVMPSIAEAGPGGGAAVPHVQVVEPKHQPLMAGGALTEMVRV